MHLSRAEYGYSALQPFKERFMKQKIRAIQIGVGSWGSSWIGKALASKNIELVAIVDVEQELLNAAAKEHGIDKNKCFLNLSEALKNVEADAAFVIVPPIYHKAVAIEALENGLHCLVEKPLAESIEDAKEIVLAAKKAGKKLMVSQNYRFKRAPQTVRSVIKKKIIGEIGSVYINFQKDPPFTGFRTQMDEPLITDMSIHHFDQIRGILGLDPVTIKAQTWNPNWSRFKGNACANVLFEMSNGAAVVYTGSWVSTGWETTWDGDWRIQGEVGEIHWANNRVTLEPKDLFISVFQDGAIEQNGKIVFDLLSMEAEERMATIAEFAQSIIEDRQPQTSGEDNLLSMAMVLGAKHSAKTGETVKVADLLD